jgi:hypothetical protein
LSAQLQLSMQNNHIHPADMHRHCEIVSSTSAEHAEQSHTA